jgi:uncharacterized protein (TIGR03067 family)
MRCGVLLVLLTFLWSGRSPADTNTGAQELEKLQGLWQAVEGELGGQKDTSPDLRQVRLRFRGDLAVSYRKDERTETAKVTLDPTRSPKAMDLKMLDGPDKGKTFACIYRLDKDRLTVCKYVDERGLTKRPTEFTTAPGDGRGCIAFRRVEPGNADPPLVTAPRPGEPAGAKPAREAVAAFIRAFRAKDLDRLMEVVDVPWFNDELEVFKDRDQLRKYWQKALDAEADPARLFATIDHVVTYGDVQKAIRRKRLRELLDGFLDKDDLVVQTKGEKSEVVLFVKVRNGKAKVVGLSS